MTKEELAHFDGQQGRPAYVAVNGKVFDVTTSSYWQEGHHQNAHRAGADLSTELLAAPHVRSVIERFPVVAALEEIPQMESKGAGSKTGILIAILLVVGLLVWLLLLRKA